MADRLSLEAIASESVEDAHLKTDFCWLPKTSYHADVVELRDHHLGLRL